MSLTPYNRSNSLLKNIVLGTPRRMRGCSSRYRNKKHRILPSKRALELVTSQEEESQKTKLKFLTTKWALPNVQKRHNRSKKLKTK